MSIILVSSDSGRSGLPLPSSPMKFQMPTAPANPPPSPVLTQKSRGVKRPRPVAESEEDEDIADDEEYVPPRWASVPQKRKRAPAVKSAQDGGRPRMANRQCVKHEEEEDHTAADDFEGPNMVVCQWRGCGQSVSRLRISHHIGETHLAIPRGEKAGDKQRRVRCQWVGCKKEGPHEVKHESLRKHIHTAMRTAYVCRCFCWTTERLLERQRKMVMAKREGKTLRLPKVEPQPGESKVWGPCLRIYAQLWRLNYHIQESHPGESKRLSSETAMLLD